jgi:SAM-dependent methyltransferase
MTVSSEFGASYASLQIARSKHPFRRLVKSFYLSNAIADVRGRAIDLGCGAGQLLRRLPSGSLGIEINPHLVEQLKAEGLPVLDYNAALDDFALTPIPVGQYETLVMSHVLEHFDNAHEVVRRLLRGCARVGIKRVVLILPCEVGYRSDATHKTYVDADYLRAHGLTDCEGFSLSRMSHFPLDRAWLGRYFVFHELKVVYHRSA